LLWGFSLKTAKVDLQKAFYAVILDVLFGFGTGTRCQNWRCYSVCARVSLLNHFQHVYMFPTGKQFSNSLVMRCIFCNGRG